MKQPQISKTLAACLFAAVLATAAQTCPADDLHSAAITAKINFQDSRTQRVNCHRVNGQMVCDEVEVRSIRSFPINNRSLINLILGRSPLASPPPNLAFGVVFGCDSAQLIVFDRGSSNVVAVVADLSSTERIFQDKVFCSGSGPCDVLTTSYEGFMIFSLRSLGTPGTNSINGGEIRLYAKGSLNREGCINKMISSGSGKINMTAEGEELEVFVSNFTVVTGKKIGTVPVPIQTSSGSGDQVATGLSSGVLQGSVLQGSVDTTVSFSGVTRSWLRSDPMAASSWLEHMSNLPSREPVIVQPDSQVQPVQP